MKFLNLTSEYAFVPVINKPTRVTKNTATALDHIITNCLNKTVIREYLNLIFRIIFQYF